MAASFLLGLAAWLGWILTGVNVALAAAQVMTAGKMRLAEAPPQLVAGS
jgi:hypothetical protein